MKQLFFFFLLLSGSLFALPETFSFKSESAPQIIVNNRILAKVNGKPITTMDVMKKMDVIFYRQFPEYRHSIQARYQFYQGNWKYILSDLIDKELILADAEENKLEVSGGDVREELEEMFGPNIIDNLDQIGLSFEEAHKMVMGDIIIRRMLFLRVNSKALKLVTPQDVIQLYEQVSKENIQPKQWSYQVISIKDLDPKKGQEATQAIYAIIKEESTPPQELLEKLQEAIPFKTTTLSLSKEFKHHEEEVSKDYKNVLDPMKPASYSSPVVQKSRSQGVNLYRIFYLKERFEGGVPSFQSLEASLKERLLNEMMQKETESYFKRLRKHFDLQEERLKEMVPQGFEPFELRPSKS